MHCAADPPSLAARRHRRVAAHVHALLVNVACHPRDPRTPLASACSTVCRWQPPIIAELPAAGGVDKRTAGCQPAIMGKTDAGILPVSARDISASVRAEV